MPGLRGLSVSEFRATPTATPDNEKGVALELATEAERDSLLQQLEADFAPRRFTNAADAMARVKAGTFVGPTQDSSGIAHTEPSQ